MCQVSIFFPLCVFRDTEVQSFSVFPTWLPHHVTYDVIIISITFYLSRRSCGENFVSIRQAVAEKNTKVLCGQTNKQDRQTNTNKKTNKQKEPTCNTLSFTFPS